MTTTLRPLRTKAVDALRWRLGFYDDLRLPPVPPEGLAFGRARAVPYTADDAEQRIALENGPGMGHWDEDFVPITTTEAYATWLEQTRVRLARERGPYSLAVRNAAGAFIGDLTIWRIRDSRRTAEFGIALLPGARGHGVATDLTSGTVDWLLDSGEFHRVDLHHVVENRAACLVASRSGVPVEGRQRRAFEERDQDGGTIWRDLCFHGVDVISRREAREPRAPGEPGA